MKKAMLPVLLVTCDGDGDAVAGCSVALRNCGIVLSRSPAPRPRRRPDGKGHTLLVRMKLSSATCMLNAGQYGNMSPRAVTCSLRTFSSSRSAMHGTWVGAFFTGMVSF